ncbi:MAG: hypothetical protein JOZ81_24610 [Chloroflexi bacterium]|nr:hypothetical protein [Chloroflexota bacterium]
MRAPVSDQLAAPTDEASTAVPTAATPHASFAPTAAAESSGSGEILNLQHADSYAFDGEQGQLLEVRVLQVAPDLNPQIELLDPSGSVEVPWHLINIFGTVEKRLASSGTYTIRVSGFYSTGRYALTWTLDRFGQLTSGNEVTGAIDQADQVDRYRFEGAQGQVIRARAYRTSGVSLEPRLDLVDPTGATETTVDGYGRPDITLQSKLASSGTYLLAVSGQKTGPYAVSLTLE